jgi:Calcineurin-like phosphoesterase
VRSPSVLAAFLVVLASPNTAQDTGALSTAVTLAAIGDAGESGGQLNDVARHMAARYSAASGRKLDGLLFLGDNFYPIGLNDGSEAEAAARIEYRVSWPFAPVLAALGRGTVHAVTGNHDYYAKRRFFRNVGFSEKGNERARRLGPWTYHYGCEPGEAVFEAAGTGARVQVLFFDSAREVEDEGGECPAFARLAERLQASHAAGVPWHVIAVHHPPETVGEHGECRSGCPKQDLHAPRYERYVRDLRAAIAKSGVPVQLVVGGHDHSLQLLARPADPGCSGCPRVHVVSGAASKVTRVVEPDPAAFEFTAVVPGSKGQAAAGRPRKPQRALPGFVELAFTADRLAATFIDGRDGSELDMGGGRRRFWIDRAGQLLAEGP